jgi:hypothetical protein
MRDGPGLGRVVHSGAQKLVGGGTTERGEDGEPSSGLTGLGRWHGDRFTVGKQQQRERSTTMALGLQKRGRCGDLRGRGALFLGLGEGAPRWETR